MRYHLPWLDKFGMPGFIEHVKGEVWYLTYPITDASRFWRPIDRFTVCWLLNIGAELMED